MAKLKEKKKKHVLRDTLAIERTELANERTFYAGIRTSLTLFVVGLTILKLFQTDWVHTVAWILILASGITMAFILFRFFSFEKMLKND